VAYHIYQTEGIVVGKKEVGEADRIFSILTKDLGRIDAISQGVRYVKSKLRYNLNDFSHSRFGLVMSKDSWRIIDAEELSSWENIRANPEKIAATFRLAELIKRMVKGQEPDFNLWNEFKNALVFLEKKENSADEKNLIIFELLTTLRLLSHLGYVEEHEKWLDLSLAEAEKIEPLMRTLINKAIEESQL
jgi:DNA repair protein RecO (recombination protein O)